MLRSRGVKSHERSWIWRSRDDDSRGKWRNEEDKTRGGWILVGVVRPKAMKCSDHAKVSEVGILVLVRRLLGEVPTVTGDAQRRAILEEILDPYEVSPPSLTLSFLRRSLYDATAQDFCPSLSS